jgi:Uma2 family endonuclease
VGLLIEVSLGTLARDQNEKLPAYARGRIPVYWIINLVDRRIEVYTQPRQGAYQSRVDFHPGEAVPVVIDGQRLGEVAVDAILPSPAGTDNGT